MELGALVCVPNGAPLCEKCPLAHLCAARAAGTALELPRKAAPKPRRLQPVTLACGKFRLNDLDLGTVAGLPRILDVGQCNDAYSAIQIALALADAFQCGVNDLPLSLVLCWFEQKAVCILIALLALGIRNIRLGPTLPAFLSPGVVRVLQEKYNLMAVTTPEQDLKAILGEG